MAMKLFFSILATIAFLFYFTPAYGVEFIMKQNDGSYLFACEIKGPAYKVSVKYRGNNVYTVFPKGRGRLRIMGNIRSSTIEGAARLACDEK